MLEIKPEVLGLYRVEIKTFALTKNEGGTHNVYVASKSTSHLVVLKEARGRFTDAWWENKSIVDVFYVGKLVMIDGVPLYEVD